MLSGRGSGAISAIVSDDSVGDSVGRSVGADSSSDSFGLGSSGSEFSGRGSVLEVGSEKSRGAASVGVDSLEDSMAPSRTFKKPSGPMEGSHDHVAPKASINASKSGHPNKPHDAGVVRFDGERVAEGKRKCRTQNLLDEKGHSVDGKGCAEERRTERDNRLRLGSIYHKMTFACVDFWRGLCFLARSWSFVVERMVRGLCVVRKMCVQIFGVLVFGMRWFDAK